MEEKVAKAREIFELGLIMALLIGTCGAEKKVLEMEFKPFCEIESDGVHLAECLEFDETGVLIKFSMSPVALVDKTSVPITVFDSKTDEMKFEASYDFIASKELIQRIDLTGSYIKFGEESTRINFSSSTAAHIYDTTNPPDGTGNGVGGLGNYMFVGDRDAAGHDDPYRGYVVFNITNISNECPTGVASANFSIYHYIMGGRHDYVNVSVLNETNLVLDNSDYERTAQYPNVAVYNVTIDFDKWNHANITAALNGLLTANDNYLAVRIQPQWYYNDNVTDRCVFSTTAGNGGVPYITYACDEGAENNAPTTPSITIGTPLYTNSSSVNCSGTVVDPDGDDVSVYINITNETKGNQIAYCSWANISNGTAWNCGNNTNNLWVYPNIINCSALYIDNRSDSSSNESFITVSNLAPEVTLNYPPNNSVNISANVTLNATGYDTDLHLMNMSFYNASDSSLICLNQSVSNGTDVLCDWTNLTCNVTHSYYVNVTDNLAITMSQINFFTTEVCNVTTTTTTTTTTTQPGQTTTTTLPALSNLRRMIYPVWYTLIGVAGVFSLLSFGFRNPRNMILYLIAGFSWFMAGASAASVSEVIVYSNTNYLQATQYPIFVVLFTLFAAAYLILFAFTFMNWYKTEVAEVSPYG